MQASVFSALCLYIVLWLYIKWNRLKNYWANRGVLFYTPYPIIGNMTFLQRKNPALFMRKAYQDFKSPYVGIWVFWRPALIINCPEISKRVLVKDFDVFQNRFLSSGSSDPVGGLNLFTVNEPIWSSVRRRLTTVFTAAKLRSLEGIIIKKTEDLVERVKEKIKKGAVDNLRELFVDFTTDVMGESAFGLTTETTKTGDSLLRNITRQYMEFNLFRGLSWSSIFFCPDLVDIFGFSLFPKSTTRLLRQIFRKTVEQRGGYNRNVSDNKDLLDALINLKAEAHQNDKPRVDTSQRIAKSYESRDSLRVHAGRDADPDEFPYIVSIQMETYNISWLAIYYNIGIRAKRICTGSAITSTWVLTAAHCIEANLLHKYMIRYGDLSQPFEDKTPYCKVSRFVPYPHYREFDMDHKYDIALLLTEEIPLIKFGRLSAIQQTALIGLPVTFAGYGLTDIYISIENIPKPLQVGEGGVVPCEKGLGMLICLRPKCSTKNQTTSFGDSGGPLIYDGQIVGVAQSVRFSSKDLKHTDMFYTPISIYISWIKKVIP